MNCAKCNKKISAEELDIFDKLVIGQGYTVPTVIRCRICKNVVCRECSKGHGYFIFTCNDKCSDKIKERYG